MKRSEVNAALRELESAGPATPAPRQAEPEGQLAMGDPAAESVSAQPLSVRPVL